MRELFLIIRREYLTRVRKKSFIVLTILMPVLVMASILLPLFLSTIKDSEPKRIAVVDFTNLYAQYLESDNSYVFETAEQAIANPNVDFDEDVFAVLQINRDLSIDSKAVVLYSNNQIPQDLLDNISAQLSATVKSQYIHSWSLDNNLDINVVSQLQRQIEKRDLVEVSTIRMEDGIAKESSTFLISAVSLGLTFFMYFFILMYGTMVINGVVEEKSNRIVEVLISTVSPFNLMMGKIIGIGLTGLTQFIVWLILAVLILVGGYFFAEESIQYGIQDDQVLSTMHLLFSINWMEILLFFLLLFIGGYLLYASLFAMFGAAVDNAQDTQQFVMPITILFVFALYAALYSLQNPDGPLALWCSMIPFTSPVVMMVRIPFGVPLWEKVLSVILLYITIVLTVGVAARIYRIGILMYGKKTTIKDLFRWFLVNRN